MKITFLGTGTSQGVPFIACNCKVCKSTDKKDNRLRSSIWIKTEDVSIVVDSGPDFRYQMLRAHVLDLDAIVFTHGHKDHIAGLDDIRPFNYINNKVVKVYASEETQVALHREYNYIFTNPNYPGIPQIEMHTITGDQSFQVNGLELIPIKLTHYQIEVLGFRIGDFTYITDANYIAPEELKKVNGSKVLILNALRHEAHPSHFTLNEAIAIAQQVDVEKVYFTHISHQLGLHEEVEKTLPENMFLTFDGLELEF